MSNKIWMGAVFLKEEGGYEIILKSLNHYKNRLKTLSNSPELKDSAAMFASVLNSQAMKTVPKINEVIQKIQNNLHSINSISTLEEDVPFLEKALACYKSDIHKAQDTGHEYFVELIGDMTKSQQNLDLITNALDKIKQYSD